MITLLLTQEEGLKVQRDGLQAWKARLNSECFTALEAFVKFKNAELVPSDDGYRVCRGDDLSEFVHNWKP